MYYCVSEPKMGNINKIVIPRIQAEWEDVAYALDYEIVTINSIKMKHNNNPKRCCRDLFIDWLLTDRSASPKKWLTLLEKLKEIDDLSLATNDITNKIEKLKNS